jgi:glycosyltransferase involved in cell wall biosynthesis
LEGNFVSNLSEPLTTRIEVVPNGVDCDYNRPIYSDGQATTLVYNGALTYHANFDAMSFFLSAVFPRIKQEIDAVQLTITGSVDGVRLSELSLNESVRLTGYLPDIRPVVANATVCVVPLREGGGTRLKILEAMALGTPVVSTSKGAEGLDVVHGEHLLIADEPDRFAAYTVELMHNAELRQRLTENARHLVEQKYDWGGIGRRFVALVEDAVQEREGIAA